MTSIDSLKLVYFSPTGTTLKTIQNIATGTGIQVTGEYNLTPAGSEMHDFEIIDNSLAIIGVPVYGGRVPLQAEARFKRIHAERIPTILVVVYGNREFEDALLELKDLSEAQGFIPVAAGAFLGEHSLSSKEMPIAPGRPDTSDTQRAQEFGKAVRQLLTSIDSLQSLSLKVPGNIPFKERRPPLKVAPYIDEALCTKCGICVPVCPTGVITLEESLVIDPENCIRCCACTRVCPSDALRFTDPGVKRTAETLFKNCSQRKEPELFVSIDKSNRRSQRPSERHRPRTAHL